MALNTRLPKAYIYTYPLLTVLKLGSLIRATIIWGIIYAPSHDALGVQMMSFEWPRNYSS